MNTPPLASVRHANRARVALIGAAIATVVLYFIPFGNYVLYPLMLFSTFVHEMGHGLTAMVLGGDFLYFKMWADGSGVAAYAGHFSGFGKALTAAGGPIGPPARCSRFVCARAPCRLGEGGALRDELHLRAVHSSRRTQLVRHWVCGLSGAGLLRRGASHTTGDLTVGRRLSRRPAVYQRLFARRLFVRSIRAHRRWLVALRQRTDRYGVDRPALVLGGPRRSHFYCDLGMGLNDFLKSASTFQPNGLAPAKRPRVTNESRLKGQAHRRI